MSLALLAVASIEDLEVRRAPVGGVAWDARGWLLRLTDSGVSWARAFATEPLLAVAGRRLYAAADGRLRCIDVLGGAEAWSAPLDAPAASLVAHGDGVEVLGGDAVQSFSSRGESRERRTVPPSTRFVRVGAIRYAAGEGGVWRIDENGVVVSLATRPCVGLWARDGTVQALVEEGEGTSLVEDAGVPMAWSFPDHRTHLFAPFGDAGWAVAPLRGASGAWVVDRRVQVRWRVPLPGPVRALATVGTAVVALVEDGAPALALLHHEVPEPLLLAAEGADTLVAEGDRLFLAGGGRTAIYRLRGP